jgi:hypothetical protein
MIEAGFIPAHHQPTEFVEFCERLESEEQMLGLNNQQDCKHAGTKGQHAEGTA